MRFDYEGYTIIVQQDEYVKLDVGIGVEYIVTDMNDDEICSSGGFEDFLECIESAMEDIDQLTKGNGHGLRLLRMP